MKKDFKFQIKSLDEQGTFAGLASVYNNVDLQNDIVEPGAFTKTLRDRQGQVPLLYQHDQREPIGIAKLSDSQSGLRVEGKLLLELPTAQKTYSLLKAGILKGLSIGFDSISDQIVNGVRRLKELRLWEISLVTFAANPEAQVMTVKSNPPELEWQIQKFREVLAECRRTF